MKTSVSGLLLVLALAPLAGCSSGAAVDDLRRVAADAGDSPSECPYDLDVADATGSDDVEAGEVDVEVSETTEPADDPLRAQQDGMTALDAAAASYVSCAYDVGGDELTVYVTTAAADGEAAALLLVPQLQNDADLSNDDIQGYLDDLDDSGDANVTPGGTGALVVVPVDGDGSAAVLVTGGAVTDDDLADAAETLADDLG